MHVDPVGEGVLAPQHHLREDDALPFLAQGRDSDTDEPVALLHQAGGYGRSADLDRPLPVSREPEQSVLASVLLVARCHVVTHAAEQQIDRIWLPGFRHPLRLRRRNVHAHRWGRQTRRSRHGRERRAVRRGGSMVFSVSLVVRRLNVRVPLLAQILGGRVLGGAARHYFLRLVLSPELGHGGDGGGPYIFGQRPTLLHLVGLLTLQQFDRATSRRQIRAELVVERVLVRDRLVDVEQQHGGGSELQFELLVRLVRGECGHGRDCARENFEASATQLAKWTSLSSVYSYAVCANVVDSRTLQTSEY